MLQKEMTLKSSGDKMQTALVQMIDLGINNHNVSSFLHYPKNEYVWELKNIAGKAQTNRLQMIDTKESINSISNNP